MSDEMMPALSARNLTKIYKTSADEVSVLSGLNMEIQAGTAAAIVGQSGRGKTTLLNLLSGLDRPTSGEVFHSNKRMDNLDEENLSEFRNKNIGFIFQHHYLLEDFTALENILLPLRIQGIKIGKTENDKVLSILNSIGLNGREKHFPEQLSGGERQRVAIARALIHEPKVVFADEPTGSLDKKNSEKVEDLLWKLKSEYHITFIIATHNLEIARKCDKIIDLG